VGDGKRQPENCRNSLKRLSFQAAFTGSLTAGVDNIAGTSGDDTVNATETATGGRVLGGLDVIDGGTGTDTLNIANSQAAATFTFGGATIKNVETINVSTNGDFTGLDISTIAGLTKFIGTAADTAKTTLTAAATTDVTLNFDLLFDVHLLEASVLILKLLHSGHQ
jgi:hypothetical protein